MKLLDALRLARSLLSDHGLSHWRVAFSSAKRQFGLCDAAKREIRLSRHLVMLNNESRVRNTILHEIAHALTPGTAHGRPWRELFIEMGGDGRRTYDASEVVTVQAPYIVWCPACGASKEAFRKAYPTSCWKCSGGRFDRNVLVRYRRRED